MRAIASQLFDAWSWVRDLASNISLRRDTAPLDSVERAEGFVATRSALITQKKLFGYLKERMGLNYPKMFADENFVRSIDIATMRVFAAALADMTVHAVAHIGSGGRLDAAAHRAMAISFYRAGLEANAERIADPDESRAWIAAFERRLGETLWENVAAGASAFTESPKALIRWAPIADELKRRDRDIVENSIRFAWNEVLTDFRRRLEADKVAGDWNARAGA